MIDKEHFSEYVDLLSEALREDIKVYMKHHNKESLAWDKLSKRQFGGTSLEERVMTDLQTIMAHALKDENNIQDGALDLYGALRGKPVLGSEGIKDEVELEDFIAERVFAKDGAKMSNLPGIRFLMENMRDKRSAAIFYKIFMLSESCLHSELYENQRPTDQSVIQAISGGLQSVAQQVMQNGVSMQEYSKFKNDFDGQFEEGSLTLRDFDKALSPLALAARGQDTDFSVDWDRVNETLAELNNLVGLDDVKAQVNSLIRQVQHSEWSGWVGVEEIGQSNHMIFTGNQGTGKTTVARIVGKIFHDLGILPRERFIEAGRVDLVGGYVGQTALKTRKVIKAALGGVLFIDEAYGLAEGGEKDFGREALTTLVAAIENLREHMVIILAGYPEDMENLLEMNQGLSSRIPHKYEFVDYEGEEIIQIFDIISKNQNYEITPAARKEMSAFLEKVREIQSPKFENGRVVRNVVERMKGKISNRLFEDVKPSAEMLQMRDDAKIERAAAIKAAKAAGKDIKDIEPGKAEKKLHSLLRTIKLEDVQSLDPYDFTMAPTDVDTLRTSLKEEKKALIKKLQANEAEALKEKSAQNDDKDDWEPTIGFGASVEAMEKKNKKLKDAQKAADKQGKDRKILEDIEELRRKESLTQK